MDYFKNIEKLDVELRFLITGVTMANQARL